jgi:uncharacterized membrane protein
MGFSWGFPQGHSYTAERQPRMSKNVFDQSSPREASVVEEVHLVSIRVYDHTDRLVYSCSITRKSSQLRSWDREAIVPRNANEELKKQKNLGDKIADELTRFAGSMTFVYVHALWFGLWIIVNLGALSLALAFDKYPFGLLTLIVSLEAIFLSTFVMISQNRQAKAAEVRSELDYETNVKAEQEIELIMTALNRIASKQGVDISDLVLQHKRVRDTAK